MIASENYNIWVYEYPASHNDILLTPPVSPEVFFYLKAQLIINY
ncbi:hypothetical protein MADA3029_400047 [Vibrio nigripulchritudo MADA3029]|nr:hypothetical protein VIBNIMADA3020_520047 [Vibrio nigripulchritudo MADA3020]CCN56350.1 hypothetical protein VIBNIMADA3021_930047 [Vibrio nigripulchritudo MADA3021]CCN59317.1 hypothetical protein MADA3029_400047 [Vibrio nigripulchritudo MADA3029]